MVGPLEQTCLSIQFHIEFCHTDHYSPVLSWPIVLCTGEHDHCPESAAEHSDLLRSALTSLIPVFWYQVWKLIFIKMPSSAVHSPSTGGSGRSFEFSLQSCIGNKRQISLRKQVSTLYRIPSTPSNLIIRISPASWHSCEGSEAK